MSTEWLSREEGQHYRDPGQDRSSACFLWIWGPGLQREKDGRMWELRWHWHSHSSRAFFLSVFTLKPEKYSVKVSCSLDPAPPGDPIARSLEPVIWEVIFIIPEAPNEESLPVRTGDHVDSSPIKLLLPLLSRGHHQGKKE